MVGIMSRRPLSHRILTCHSRESELSGDHTINISDTVFSFLDEERHQGSSSLESVGDDVNYYVEEDENEEKENNNNSEHVEDSQFWEARHQLLQSVLCRTTTLESEIRRITKETLKEVSENGYYKCNCSWKMINNISCQNCLMKEVCSRLQNAGFNSAICKSKWRSSPHIPSGDHTFIDVVDNSSLKKGEVRVIIELNFRAEFEMAKASEEYKRLVKCLPEVFVGKIERLLSLTKIMCDAAKKCMKEKKMHMAPWRKQKYMQAKWLKTVERMTSKSPLSADEYYSNRLPRRPKASMLTVDLLENFPNLHRTVVEVV
ncbi:putative L-type lectin-domain containing receptor kinase VII.1-like [Capsicum annuum]|nr:putative L-type lectin-domain containing receptor kinase VII.1-like [Capsicum annuum]